MGDWQYTLLADGPTDARLLHVIDWSLEQLSVEPVTGQFADHRALVAESRRLVHRIPAALEAFPCDLLVIHRDAEAAGYDHRLEEVSGALEELDLDEPPHVVLIPVRMQETWLLIDEPAIREASGNPNGTTPISLPALSQLEGVSDPKGTLEQCLRDASELTGRRLRRFSANRAANRLSELIGDFSPLRQLSAFQEFEQSLGRALAELGISSERATPSEEGST